MSVPRPRTYMFLDLLPGSLVVNQVEEHIAILNVDCIEQVGSDLVAVMQVGIESGQFGVRVGVARRLEDVPWLHFNLANLGINGIIKFIDKTLGLWVRVPHVVPLFGSIGMSDI